MKRFLGWLVAWCRRKIDEDTISEKEAEWIWREVKEMMEEYKVK